jgi:hypothetical protein
MIRAARNGSGQRAHAASPHPPQGGLRRPLKHNAPTLCAVALPLGHRASSATRAAISRRVTLKAVRLSGLRPA